jgi:acetyltransferase
LLSVDSVKERYTSEQRLRSGIWVVFRPIGCSDQELFKAFFKSLSPVSVHFRFLEMVKELPAETVERYCNLDYNKELAIVALPKDDSKIVAVVCLMINRKELNGEFTLVIADAWQGVGLGAALMEYVIKIAEDYGLLELRCTVSTDNLRMVGLAEKFGLTVKSTDGDTVEMTLKLSSAAPL